jgi:Contractile injection system tube protein
MSSFPNSPRLLKGGLVLVDPASGAVLRVIALQYNPESLTRTLQVQAISSSESGGGGDRSESLRLKAVPVETYKLEIEIDAVDQLEQPQQNPAATEHGILPQLAALETVIYPTAAALTANNALAGAGTLEIIPMEAPLALFVWSKSRVVPVRITDLSVTEEAFDPALNPIRAKVSLGLRVLSIEDLGFAHRGGGLFMTHLRNKEALAQQVPPGALSVLGLGGPP